MKITYDHNKDAKNSSERNLPFAMVADLEWTSAVMIEDNRKDYGERRFRVFGVIAERLYVVVVTFRDHDIHVISFRKANEREIKRYGNQKKL